MGTEFNKAQFDAIYPDGIEHHYWNDGRNKILAHTSNSAKAKSNILEVGCGKGIVSEYLHNAGFKMQGGELADVPTKDELKAYVRTNLSVFEEPHPASARLRRSLPSPCLRFSTSLHSTASYG